MILSSKTVVLLSIVLLIGTVFGAIVANAFADDPFKNIGGIHKDILPVGLSDKIKIFPYYHH